MIRKIIIGVFVALMVCLAIMTAATSIYCWINFAGKPVGEVPAWALWFMW